MTTLPEVNLSVRQAPHEYAEAYSAAHPVQSGLFEHDDGSLVFYQPPGSLRSHSQMLQALLPTGKSQGSEASSNSRQYGSFGASKQPTSTTRSGSKTMTTLAPSPDYPERPGTQYDKIIATPKRNALGQRSGERFAEDGTSWQPEYLGAFRSSVADTVSGASHQCYDAKVADQAGGRNALGGGNPAPAWDAVAPEVAGQFQGGASGDGGRAYPYPHMPGAGFNSNTISPLDGLALGERPNTRIVHQIAENTAKSRRNQADVSDL